MKNREEFGSDFVLCVSEMVGGMNDRGISIDMVKLLEGLREKQKLIFWKLG